MTNVLIVHLLSRDVRQEVQPEGRCAFCQAPGVSNTRPSGTRRYAPLPMPPTSAPPASGTPRRPTPELQSRRLVLRGWRPSDAEPFATLSADPRVTEHLPAPLSREESDTLIQKLATHFGVHGFGMWAVEVPGEASLIGFVGLNVPTFQTSFTPCVEIGWRLAPAFWGKGYAREAARVALTHAFETLGLDEVLAWTAPANTRSRRVMDALGMTHDPADDFDHPNLAEGHRLRRHVLYRVKREAWGTGPARDPASSILDRARAFAKALDEDDFERVRPLLADACEYEARGAKHRGADAILRSYAEASRFARSSVEEVRYESKVEAADARATVHFTDILRQGIEVHRHHAEQHLTFDAEGKIVRIVHEDLPGERERVAAFLDQHGTRAGLGTRR